MIDLDIVPLVILVVQNDIFQVVGIALRVVLELKLQELCFLLCI